VGAARARRDAVHVRADVLVGGLGPDQGHLAAAAGGAGELVADEVERGGSGRYRRFSALGDDLAQVLGDAAGVEVLDASGRRLRLVDEDDLDAGVEVALALERVADELDVEARLVAEDLGVGPEGGERAGAARLLDPLELARR